MSNHFGDTIILTGSWQRLTEAMQPSHIVTVRSAQGNGRTVYLGKASNSITGFLLNGESKTYLNVPAFDVWVNGTAGDTVYWDGTQ